MESRATKQGIVWGGLLILLGGMLFVETLVDLGDWIWVAALAVAGLGVYGVYAMDRTESWMLILSYALLAIALMIALITLSILEDAFVATYVLSAIAMPFVVAFLRGDRTRWGILIPAYILLAIGVMVPLTEVGILDDELVAAYVMLVVALPFFIVYVRDRKQWWALVPGGITGIIGLAFLAAEAAVEYIVPAVLIIAGAIVLFRQLTSKESTPPTNVEPTGPKPDVFPEE